MPSQRHCHWCRSNSSVSKRAERGAPSKSSTFVASERTPHARVCFTASRLDRMQLLSDSKPYCPPAEAHKTITSRSSPPFSISQLLEPAQLKQIQPVRNVIHPVSSHLPEPQHRITQSYQPLSRNSVLAERARGSYYVVWSNNKLERAGGAGWWCGSCLRGSSHERHPS